MLSRGSTRVCHLQMLSIPCISPQASCACNEGRPTQGRATKLCRITLATIPSTTLTYGQVHNALRYLHCATCTALVVQCIAQCTARQNTLSNALHARIHCPMHCTTMHYLGPQCGKAHCPPGSYSCTDQLPFADHGHATAIGTSQFT
jgi:hypothetical protein